MRTDRRRNSFKLYERLVYIKKEGTGAYLSLGNMKSNMCLEVSSNFTNNTFPFIGSTSLFMIYIQSNNVLMYTNENLQGMGSVNKINGIYKLLIRPGQITDVNSGKVTGKIISLKNPAPLSVFPTSTKSEGNLYYFNIKENGKYIMKLIPVKRKSDGMIGMYDKVGGKFYTSPNGAKFSGGVSRRISLLPLFTSVMAERRAA